MDDPKPGKNFAVSQGPVNSRLIAPQALPADDTPPLVLARLEAVKARLQLGAPLAARLPPQQQQTSPAGALSTRQIISVVGATVSGVGLTLGLIQSAILVIGASTILLCGFGAVAYIDGKARRRAGGHAAAPNRLLVDAKDIALLDAAMEKLAATAPQETMDRLTELKEQISHSLALLTETQNIPASLDEDTFFVRECVRRYLPDSINGFLRVPLKDRMSLPMDDGKTAQALLHDQFDMLKEKLQSKENRLTQLAGESLMQQQRFLTAKTGTRK